MIKLRFGGPAWQFHYDRADLCAADRARAGERRAPRAQRDWQVSRAVAAALRRAAGVAPETTLSLSHKQGHALAGLAPAGWTLAVDLERCQPRDTAALAAWVCTDAEQAALAGIAGVEARLEAFYMVWTLKEALLKAAGLPFPAGMRQVGLGLFGGAGIDTAELRAPGPDWEARAWRLPDGWIAAAAWRAPAAAAEAAAVAVQWQSGNEAGEGPLPTGGPALLGRWRSAPAAAGP